MENSQIPVPSARADAASANCPADGVDGEEVRSFVFERDAAPVAAAFVVLFLVGFALALAISGTVVPDTQLYFAKNELDLGVRMRVLGAAAGLGLFTSWLGIALVGVRTVDGRARLSGWARFLAPLLVTPALMPLLSRPTWEPFSLMFLVSVAALGFALERLLRQSLKSIPPELGRLGTHLSVPRKLTAPLSAMLLGACVLYYFFHVGQLTQISHQKLQTMSSDLAEFDNLFFNALHGHPFRAPAIDGDLRNWGALKVHAEFGLYSLLPLYALKPGAATLLWIQTGLIAVTAVPIYLLGRARLGPLSGLLFGASYLLLPAVECPNFYDFHFTPLGMFWVAWLLYFVSEQVSGNRRASVRFGTFITFAFALVSREDMAIGLAALGLLLFFHGKLVRLGLTLFAVAATYFGVMKFAVMPAFGTMWFDTVYEDLKAPGGKGFGAVTLTLLTNPIYSLRTLLIEPKFLYALHMTVPVAALWLRRPVLWLAIIPGFVSTLLVTNRLPMYEVSFQYTYLWVPYIMAASVWGLSLLALEGRPRQLAATAALTVSVLLCGHQFGVLLGGSSIRGGLREKTFEQSAPERARLQSLESLIARIPQEASVAASESEGPHVSTRLVMYSLKYTLGENTDYVLVGDAGIPSERQHLVEALRSGRYGLEAQNSDFCLFRRGGTELPDAVRGRYLGRR